MPHFQRHVFVCTNSRPPENPKGSCGQKGADAILAAMKAEMRAQGLKDTVRANKSGCLDSCELGVVIVVYPEAVWYQHVTLEDVQELVREHVVGGRPVERLMIPRPPNAELQV